MKGLMSMAQFRNRLGQVGSLGLGGKLKISKKGDWEGVYIALNKLEQLPDALGRELIEIAHNIIRPTLDETKFKGDFEENTDVTLKLKGPYAPWNDGDNVTGFAEVSATGTGKSGVVVKLDGDMQIQQYVNEGFYSTWGGYQVEGRDLYGQAWQNCEDDVKSAIDSLVAQYTGG